MGEWSEDEHPRATDGKFTDGEAGEHASTASARVATKRAADQLHALASQKPKIDASAKEHAAHADRLREASSALGKASTAHLDAANAATSRGETDKAREHIEASRQIDHEARSRLSEAREHEALARVNQTPEEKASRSEAHSAHVSALHERGRKREHEDSKASPKAHGGGHHKEGIAHWVAEKLKEAPESIHRAGERVREVEDRAIEYEPKEHRE